MKQLLTAHLRHDAAIAGATHALGVVSLRVPPEHLKEVFDELYRVFFATLAAYEDQKVQHKGKGPEHAAEPGE